MAGCADILSRHQDEWKGAVTHPFLTAVQDGTIQAQQFDAWLGQCWGRPAAAMRSFVGSSKQPRVVLRRRCGRALAADHDACLGASCPLRFARATCMAWC